MKNQEHKISLLEKLIKNKDLKEGIYNLGLFYIVGRLVATIGYTFGMDLDKYHSVEHLAVGAGLGTFFYRKLGKGISGILGGITATTTFNIGWEFMESKGITYEVENKEDTLADVLAVYSGYTLGLILEKLKSKYGLDEALDRNIMKS